MRKKFYEVDDHQEELDLQEIVQKEKDISVTSFKSLPNSINMEVHKNEQ